MRPLIAASIAVLVLAGCAKPEPQAGGDAPSAPMQNSETSHHETLRSAKTLLEGSIDSVQAALQQASADRDRSSGDVREGLSDIVAMLDSVGATLQEANIDLPEAKDVNRQEFRFKALKNTMLEAASDVYLELRDALGTAQGIAEVDPTFADLANLIQLATDDVAEVIQSLGGTVPVGQEADPPSQA